MWLLAFTLWFGIASLFGPALCCCHAATAVEAPRAPVAPAKPVKSCCHPEPAPTEQPPVPAPKEKPKCPCGQGQTISDAILPSDNSADEVAGQLGDSGFDIPMSGLYLAPTSPVLATSVSTSTSHQLSGRALLAAHSTLRC